MNFNNNEFTLLSDEQTFGSQQIDVIDKMGGMCAISDFAILLGAYVSDDYHVDGDRSLKGRTGWWYLSSSVGDEYVRDVSKDGDRGWTGAGKRSGAVRPALPYSNISDISPNGVRGRSGILEVEYGEYPQYAVDTRLARTLDSEFSAGRLRKTGKTYTTDSCHWDSRFAKFNPVEHKEFEYNGKKYVRVKSNDTGENFKLTNGATAHPGDYFWLEVSPITWLVDEKSRLMLSKTCLASGIRFCDDFQYRDDFKRTEMYMFLNKYFAKDIVPSKTRFEADKKASEKDLKKQKENQEEKQTENQKEISDIEQLINEISMQIKNIPNKELIVKEVNDLVKEYNAKVKLLSNKERNVLSFDSLGSLKSILKTELTIILDRVKLFCEENNKYLELLGYIDKALLCINGKNVEDDNELLSDLKIIGEVSLPFLKEEKRKEIQDKFSKLLLDEKDKIMKYLDDILMDKAKTEKPQCKTKEELEIYIRTKMHPLLIELSNAVVKRDLQTEINSKFAGIMNGRYEESKNKRISFYLNEINNTFNKIVNLSNSFNDDRSSKYINQAKEIMKKEIDYTKSAEEINKEVVMILISLYGILNDIESELEYINEFKDSYIDVSL